MEKKRKSTSVSTFRQHWIVWFLGSRPDELTVKTRRVHYHRRKLLQGFNESFIHPRESTTAHAQFPTSLWYTWIFILPFWLLALCFGKVLPFGYRTVTVKSEAAENKIKYVTNYKALIKQLINGE